jgi:cytoskeleton protein RodZ
VYVRGYLSRYADLLGLDEADRSALLSRIDGDAPEVRTVFETAAPVQASDRWLRVASYLLASLLVGTLAWQLAHEAVRLAKVKDGAESEIAATDASPPAAHVNASIGGLESLHEASGSRTGNAGALAWEALREARDQQALRTALAEGEHLLVVETSADTWVEIHGADEALLEQDLLRGGERRTYQAVGPYRISLGRASAVRLTLDGQPVPLEPFTREDVARVLLDPATFLTTP